MQQNRVKKILREGGLALGTHVGGIPDPQIVELIGLAGFDAAFIDMEHTTFDLHNVQAMVMASERIGVTPIVRTPGFDPAFILRLLDMGVQGVQVPHVSSAAVAREAVKAVRYPPEGERGMAAGSRAANFGKTPLLEHMAQSNREALLACMIEDMEAVAQIEAGVLHVDKRRVEPGETDDLDDLRVGNAADMGAQGEAAFAQDALDPVLFHNSLPKLLAAKFKLLVPTWLAAGWR